MSNSNPLSVGQVVHAYTTAGIKPTLFRLWAVRPDGTCGCNEAGCTRAGKHPAYPYGRLESGEQVFGNAGHGLVTGYKSGIFVVDTDGPEADARFIEAWYADENAPELDTFQTKTPSGGFHYHFEYPGFPVRTSQGEFLRTPEEAAAKPKAKSSKIDIRGDVNGYVVLPGSPHVSGGEYKLVNNAKPMKAPAWLLEWPGLRGSNTTASSASLVPVIPVDVETDEGKRRIELAREACMTMEAAVSGENGSLSLWNVAMHLVRELELPLNVAQSLIQESYNPRCEPPWSPKEIEHKLENARDRSDRLPGLVPDNLLDDAANKPIKFVGPKPDRRTHNPAHVYECAIGDIPNGARKCTQGEVLSELFGNPSWQGVLQHDEFRDRVFAVDPPIELKGAQRGELNDADIVAVRHWFECMGQKSVPKDMAWDCVSAVARKNSFHPLREYLNSLPPVAGAIERLSRDAMGLSDPFDQMYVRRFLVAAVRRAFEPGCKVDNMLVLKGAPGLKKSTFVLALFGEEWTSENLTNIEDAKAVGEVLNGKWAIEVAEMKDIMRAGNETVAAFITRRSERFRTAYARGNAVDFKRTAVLVGSTNEDEILRNSTGADARRFWIVEPNADVAGKIDIGWIEKHRDQIWGEAVALARAGERHWLEGDEETRHYDRMKRFEDRDACHDDVELYCIGRDFVRAVDIWKQVYGTSVKKVADPRELKAITNTLRRLGCKTGQKGAHRTRGWFVPEALKNSPVPENEAVRRATAVAETEVATRSN